MSNEITENTFDWLAAAESFAGQLCEMRLQRNALLDALERIMTYAHTGAHASDIDVNEQPEFINARAAIARAKNSLAK